MSLVFIQEYFRCHKTKVDYGSIQTKHLTSAVSRMSNNTTIFSCVLTRRAVFAAADIFLESMSPVTIFSKISRMEPAASPSSLPVAQSFKFSINIGIPLPTSIGAVSENSTNDSIASSLSFESVEDYLCIDSILQ